MSQVTPDETSRGISSLSLLPKPKIIKQGVSCEHGSMYEAHSLKETDLITAKISDEIIAAHTLMVGIKISSVQ